MEIVADVRLRHHSVRSLVQFERTSVESDALRSLSLRKTLE